MKKMVHMYIIVNHTNVDCKQVNKTMINHFLVSPKMLSSGWHFQRYYRLMFALLNPRSYKKTLKRVYGQQPLQCD